MVSPRRRRQPAHGARVPAVTDAVVEAAEPGPEAAVVAISLDGVLWLALIVLAVALRFFSLDRLPLSEADTEPDRKQSAEGQSHHTHGPHPANNPSQ